MAIVDGEGEGAGVEAGPELRRRRAIERRDDLEWVDDYGLGRVRVGSGEDEQHRQNRDDVSPRAAPGGTVPVPAYLRAGWAAVRRVRHDA
jgi:hypothetical protein